MATENFELRFRPWKAKMLEKITLSEMKIKDRVELTDEDWDFQEFLCRLWFFGVHPIYGTKMKGKEEVAVPQGLFADNTTENLNGTEIDNTVLNQTSKDNE